MKKKTKWTPVVEADKASFHYFASSPAEWKVGNDLGALIAHMKRESFAFNVYLVRLPIEAPYEIDYYRPKLGNDTLQWIAAYRAQ